jgi:hypothetical protein
MANQPKTPNRAFRAGDEYDRARTIARARGENLSEHVLRPALRAYIAEHARKPPPSRS